MSHSSSSWHETSISSVIPKHIVDPRKQNQSDITILIIHTSLSPSFYSPENWRRVPDIYRLFTPWKRWCPQPPAPAVELAARHPQPVQQSPDRQLGAPRPVVDELDDGVADGLGNP